MLCLSRKKHEGVTIVTPSGETIRVVIGNVDHGKVKLVFEADKRVAIHRDELLTDGDGPMTTAWGRVR